MIWLSNSGNFLQLISYPSFFTNTSSGNLIRILHECDFYDKLIQGSGSDSDSKRILKDVQLVTTDKKFRILIADDNQANRELVEAILSPIDCVMEIAIDGRDTMNKAVSFQPDLILLDVMMPKLSGFEVCEKIKQDSQLKGIMILMVTALNELGDIERAVAAGTNDFLSKPINRVELLKRVENLLALKEVTDENERLRQYIQNMEASRV